MDFFVMLCKPWLEKVGLFVMVYFKIKFFSYIVHLFFFFFFLLLHKEMQFCEAEHVPRESS